MKKCVICGNFCSKDLYKFCSRKCYHLWRKNKNFGIPKGSNFRGYYGGEKAKQIKEKISEGCKGRKVWNKGIKGYTFEELIGVERARLANKKRSKSLCKYYNNPKVLEGLSIINREKEQVIKWYIQDKLSTLEISRRLYCDKKGEHVRRHLHKWGIKVRTAGESLRGRKQSDKEKAKRIQTIKKQRIGKKWEDLYGLERTKEMKTKISRRCKNKTYEERFGIGRAKEIKKRISESNKGKPSWIKGKHHSIEARIKISEANKGKKLSEEHIKKIREANIGKKMSEKNRLRLMKLHKGNTYSKGLIRSDEFKKKISLAKKGINLIQKQGIKKAEIIRKKMAESTKKNWKKKEYREKVIKNSRYIKCPTKPELELLRLIQDNKLPFTYTGNGSCIIEGLNPDFVSTNNERLIIEMFGRQFHDPNNTFLKKIDYKRTEKGRKEIFAKSDYKTLIVWDDELKNSSNTLNKIYQFMGGYSG